MRRNRTPYGQARPTVAARQAPVGQQQGSPQIRPQASWQHVPSNLGQLGAHVLTTGAAAAMLQAWDRNLPHMRNQCGVHRNFSRAHGTGNAAYCAKVRLQSAPIYGSLRQPPLILVRQHVALHAQQARLHPNPCFVLQCYCFMCDAEASQCKEWGTGEAAITLPRRACTSRRSDSRTSWMLRSAAKSCQLSSVHLLLSTLRWTQFQPPMPGGEEEGCQTLEIARTFLPDLQAPRCWTTAMPVTRPSMST